MWISMRNTTPSTGSGPQRTTTDTTVKVKEPDAVIPHVRFGAGGRPERAVPTATTQAAGIPPHRCDDGHRYNRVSPSRRPGLPPDPGRPAPRQPQIDAKSWVRIWRQLAHLS